MGRHASNDRNTPLHVPGISESNVFWISVVVLLAVFILGSLGYLLWPKDSDNSKTSTTVIPADLNRDQIVDLYSKGEYKRIIPSLKRLVSANQSDAAMREMLATSYLMTGDNKKSLDEYEATLKMKPNDPELLYRIGILLQRANRPTEAITYLSRAVQAAPGVLLFHTELARANTRARLYGNALQEWRQALTMLPANDKTQADILAEIAGIHIMQNDLEKAREIIDTGLAINPDSEPLKTLQAKVEEGTVPVSPALETTATTGASAGGE